MTDEIREILQRIAREELGLDTLERRFSDRLDFKEHAVWSVTKALLAAYNAGFAAGRKRSVNQ